MGAGLDSDDLAERFLSGPTGELASKPAAAVAAASPDLATFMAYDPSSVAIAEAQARLPVAQQYKLEAILQERAKLLSRFFEQQLKKQYDVMKKEVTRLARQHERDVRSLDERFKVRSVTRGCTHAYRILPRTRASGPR